MDECAETMITAVREYGREHLASSVRLVRFVVFGREDYGIFQKYLEPAENNRA